MKFTEAILPNQLAEVYHASGDINCFKYVMNHDWRDGDCGQLYGSGIYCCWSFDSAFFDKNSHGRSNGTSKRYYLEKDIDSGRALTDDSGRPVLFRFAFLVDLKDYFFFEYKPYKTVHPESTATEETFIEEQNEKFGTNYKEKSDFYHYKFKSVVPSEGKPQIKGIVFVGNNDGDVVIIYDTEAAIPTRFSRGSVDEWFEVDSGDLSYSEKVKVALGLKSRKDYWATFTSSGAFKDYMDFLNKLSDLGSEVDKLKYINSNGIHYYVEESLEEEISIDQDSVEIVELKNCDELVKLDLSMVPNISSLIIENEYDPDLSEISGLNTQNTFKSFVINKAPKFTLEHMANIQGNGTVGSIFKLRQIKLDGGVSAENFNDFKLIGINTYNVHFNGIGSGTVLIKNASLDTTTISNVEVVTIKSSSISVLNIVDNNGIKELNILDGSDIEKINVGDKSYSMDDIEDLIGINVNIG